MRRDGWQCGYGYGRFFAFDFFDILQCQSYGTRASSRIKDKYVTVTQYQKAFILYISIKATPDPHPS